MRDLIIIIGIGAAVTYTLLGGPGLVLLAALLVGYVIEKKMRVR